MKLRNSQETPKPIPTSTLKTTPTLKDTPTLKMTPAYKTTPTLIPTPVLKIIPTLTQTNNLINNNTALKINKTTTLIENITATLKKNNITESLATVMISMGPAILDPYPDTVYGPAPEIKFINGPITVVRDTKLVILLTTTSTVLLGTIILMILYSNHLKNKNKELSERLPFHMNDNINYSYKYS